MSNDRRAVREPKRVRLSGAGEWFNTLVEVDGKALEVLDLSISVGVDEASTVTLVLPASSVQFDLQSSADEEFFVKDAESA